MARWRAADHPFTPPGPRRATAAWLALAAPLLALALLLALPGCVDVLPELGPYADEAGAGLTLGPPEPAKPCTSVHKGAFDLAKQKLPAGICSISGAVTGKGSAIGNAQLAALAAVETIGGDLTLTDTAVTSLASLKKVRTIGGKLTLSSNAALADVSGLAGVTSVGGDVWIHKNAKLKSLSALKGVQSVKGMLRVQANPALVDVAGLAKVQSVKTTLEISGNPALTSVAGLASLTAVGALEIADNPKLANLNGLKALATVQTRLELSDAGATSLPFLGTLAGGVTEIYLRDLPKLASLPKITAPKLAKLALSNAPLLESIGGVAVPHLAYLDLRKLPLQDLAAFATLQGVDVLQLIELAELQVADLSWAGKDLELYVNFAPKLEKIVGPAALDRLDVRINSVPKLATVAGFSQIGSWGRFEFSGIPTLGLLGPLSKPGPAVQSLVWMYGTDKDLAFDGVETVATKLLVDSNFQLQTLRFGSLVQVGLGPASEAAEPASFGVGLNHALTALEVPKLAHVYGKVWLCNNKVLPEAVVDAVLQQLTTKLEVQACK